MVMMVRRSSKRVRWRLKVRRHLGMSVLLICDDLGARYRNRAVGGAFVVSRTSLWKVCVMRSVRCVPTFLVLFWFRRWDRGQKNNITYKKGEGARESECGKTNFAVAAAAEAVDRNRKCMSTSASGRTESGSRAKGGGVGEEEQRNNNPVRATSGTTIMGKSARRVQRNRAN